MVLSKSSITSIILALIVTIIATDIYLPSLPEMTSFFKASSNELQLSIPLYMIGGVIATPFCGISSDHFGRKPTMILGFSIFVLGSLICFIAYSLSTLLLGRFIQGVGSVVVPIVGWTIIQDYYPGEKSAKVMSWMGSIVSLGPLIAPSLGGIIDSWCGWRANFLFMFVSSLGLLVGMIAYFPGNLNIKHQTRKELQVFRPYVDILKNNRFLSYIILYSFLLCGEMAYFTVIPFFFKESFNLSPDFIGLNISIVSCAYIVGTLLASRIVQIMGIDKSILTGIFISFCGAINLLIISMFNNFPLPLILIAISIYMVGVALLWGPTTSAALQLFAKQRSAASAVRSLIVTFALAAGGVAGSLLDDTSVLPLALFLIATCVISFIIFAFFIKTTDRDKTYKAEGV